MFTFIVIFSVLSQLIIALFVFVSSKKIANKLFSILSIFLAFWASINYIITQNPYSSNQLTLYRVLMCSVVLQNTFFLFFAHSYPDAKIKFSQKKMELYILLSVIAFIVTLSPFLFTSVNYGVNGARPVGGPGMIIFIIHSAISIFYGLRSIYRKRQKAKGNIRYQMSFLLLGSIILWGIVPLTNFIISNATETLFFARISPIYTFAFTTVVAFAILKYKLFNLRAFVARTTTYLLTIAVFLSGYTVIVASINNLIFKGNQISLAQQLVYASIAVFSAPILILIKKEFDRISSKIFYRDSYDSQNMLDELNKALVTNVDLESLLTKSALILQENLKTSFATFYIRETSYFDPRIIGAHRSFPEFKDIEQLQSLASATRKRVVVSDESLTSEKSKNLKKILDSNDIEIMARLVSTLDYDVKGIGYLFMGPKKSGTPYSKQDVKIVEIVANELVIATENILRFEEIEQFNVTLQKKIDEATKELKQTNDKLRALDEAKDEFVSMASHQLRTPLTSIKGYISMVLEGDAGKVSDTQKDMLGQAFFSSQRMVYLISDLLNVSRLKTGKFNIEAKPVYLPDLIQSELEQLHEGAKAKNLTLSFHKPEKFATLNLDEMKIRQVVMNFTDNAIYYTPSGGKIAIELKETAKSVEFTVKDSGIGVPKDQQHKLFVKFYRADNARKARPDGTGLGLFMAKKVIIAQGGSMIFDSKEGKGSTFGFSFPKEKLEVTTLPKDPNKKSENSDETSKGSEKSK